MYQDKLPIIRIKHFNKSKKSFMLVESVDRNHAIHVSRISIKSPAYQELLKELENKPFTREEFYDLYEWEI